VELTEPVHPARSVVTSHKEQFLRALVETARKADAADPELLRQQLMVLVEGATARQPTPDSAQLAGA